MTPETTSPRIAAAGKYFSFVVGSEEFGLEILKVQEIIGLTDVTSVPRTPDYIRGVMNLHGRTIPLVSLRQKLGMETVEDTDNTCIIVAQVSHADTEVTMGFIVDEVSEVLSFTHDQIESPPSFGANLGLDIIIGTGKQDGKSISLLDIDKVLEGDELDAVASVTV